MAIFAKKPKTYSTLHNRAVTIFQKSSKIMIWAAILNICGALFGMMLSSSNSGETGFGGGYALCLGTVHYLILVMQWNLLDNIVLLNVLIFLIAAVFSALLIVFASFSIKINIVWIIISFAFYLCDSIVAVFSFLNTGFANYCVAMITHIIILFFAFLCVFSYYNVIAIEKRFKNVQVKDGKVLRQEKEDEEHKYDFLEK